MPESFSLRRHLGVDPITELLFFNISVRGSDPGFELYKIYRATGKKREADRLTARMRKSGIEISED